MQNYASKVKVINSFRAKSAEFLSCKAGELITLIAKDCHRYTVIFCFSAFSLVADRLAKLACELLLWGLKRGLDFFRGFNFFHKVVTYGVKFLVHGSTSDTLQTHGGCLENSGKCM